MKAGRSADPGTGISDRKVGMFLPAAAGSFLLAKEGSCSASKLPAGAGCGPQKLPPTRQKRWSSDF